MSNVVVKRFYGVLFEDDIDDIDPHSTGPGVVGQGEAGVVAAVERAMGEWRGTREARAETLAALRNREAEVADLRARLAELEAADRWIPVDVRLPEQGVAVYISGPEIQQAVAVYAGDADPWRLEADRGKALRGEYVTHWRPLLAGPVPT